MLGLSMCVQDVYEKWCKVLDTVPMKDQALEEELAKQQHNDQLRVDFAEKANAIGAYIDERSAALAELSMGAGGGTMEEQLATVKAFQSETTEYQPQIEAAEAANQVHIGCISNFEGARSSFRKYHYTYIQKKFLIYA